MADAITDNAAASRFELEIGGQTVFARYRRQDDTVVILHVEAPPNLRGTGAAGRLMQGIADRAKAEGLKLVPVCSYAAAWLKRHPQ